ncbi:MAG: DUF4351 domain-containing protein [Acaryochloris sp. RU_4_1]|nr:DUF4351 domain-containing protein [Acaryochloris sp. SU_5_25]NJM65263.1 DUF4351 domain-containing protein [Acaryochloris sp. RU_4_1]NJN38206.1 DUF4351 domain-containing protein [Acaryochloridaceae cyanobacterium CSU_3_4]NJR54827.1 DUF4351 domain-containing protein [Acaryochloris sp. CRU_2_0]
MRSPKRLLKALPLKQLEALSETLLDFWNL